MGLQEMETQRPQNRAVLFGFLWFITRIKEGSTNLLSQRRLLLNRPNAAWPALHSSV